MWVLIGLGVLTGRSLLTAVVLAARLAAVVLAARLGCRLIVDRSAAWTRLVGVLGELLFVPSAAVAVIAVLVAEALSSGRLGRGLIVLLGARCLIAR